VTTARRAPLLLRDGAFARLWLAQVLSQSGTRMALIALAWWLAASDAAHAGLRVGAFLVATSLPGVVAAAWLGRLVDRTPVRRLMVTLDVAATLAAALMVALLRGDANGLPPAPEGLRLAAVFAASLVVATLQQGLDTALNKAVAELVPPEDLDAAVALQTTTQSLASFGGAVAGAGLLAVLSLGGVLALNAASYLVSALVGATLTYPYAVAAPPTAEALPKAAPLPAVIRRTLWGFGAVNFFVVPLFLVLPLYAAHVAHGSAALVAALEAAFWAGLTLGALGVGTLAARVADAHALAGGAMLAFAAALAGSLAAFDVPGALGGALVVGGASVGAVNARFLAYFHGRVAPEAKGRFFATLGAITSASFPAAYLLFGALADLVRPSALVLVQSLGIAAVGLVFLALRRAAR
jgi:hypothetical protein